jgi:hypothetical protein
MITQDQVKDLFDYRDGELYWQISTSNIKIGAKAGSVNSNGYRAIKVNGKHYKAHRLIFLYHYGYLPKYLDHIDGNSLNNCIKNLRPATISENSCNTKKRTDNKSGIKGVSWNKQNKKWIVQLQVKNKNRYFGLYHDIEIAKFIAETMRYKYHGAFARYGEVE